MRISDWIVWKKELYCKRIKKLIAEYVKAANGL